jgi:hypothetical protein
VSDDVGCIFGTRMINLKKKDKRYGFYFVKNLCCRNIIRQGIGKKAWKNQP